MPIALERRSEIGRSSFNHSTGCAPIFQPPEIAGEAVKMTPPPPVAAAAVEEVSACTSSSSSIGKNSENLNGSDGEDLAGEKEVESAYKGPLSALESLEEAIPMRRSISNFYNGKSKSFTSLSDAIVSCASVKDLGKQENAYTRKRRNLLASKNFSLKSSSTTLKSNGGGIYKRPPSSSRSTLALAVAMNNNNNTCEEEQQDQKHRLLPPLHPSVKSSASVSSPIRSSSPQYCSFPLRSFSLTDLQGLSGSGSSIGLQDEHKSFY